MSPTISLLTPMVYMTESMDSRFGVSRSYRGQTTISYIGHSCYLISAPDGTQTVTDPYGVFPPLPFSVPSADLVTISHNHLDHNAGDRVGGHPEVIRTAETKSVGMVNVQSYYSSHPEYRGIKIPNLIFHFQIGEFKLVHLGELGEPPSDRVSEAIQDADLLFFAIGFTDGLTTLREMYRYILSLNPKSIVPGHYSPSAEDRWYGMATVDEFIGIVCPDTRIIIATELQLRHAGPTEPKSIVI